MRATVQVFIAATSSPDTPAIARCSRCLGRAGRMPAASHSCTKWGHTLRRRDDRTPRVRQPACAAGGLPCRRRAPPGWRPPARCLPYPLSIFGSTRYIVGVKLPEDVRERYQSIRAHGGRARAGNLDPQRRTEIARRAATARWVRRRFGASRFADLALPGGDLVDEGLSDLASGRTSAASLLVSLAAPRLRREGVPVTNTQPNPELQLYRLLSSTEGELAYARYNAHLRLIVSFADSCSVARLAKPEPHT